MTIRTIINSLNPVKIRKSIQGFLEQECLENIDEILNKNPKNIDKKVFKGEYYIVYSDSYTLDNQKVYDGIVYSVYKDKILLNGRDISHKLSSEFYTSLFDKLTEQYFCKYQPSKTR